MADELHVDWSREPASEREAQVRKIWLERRLSGNLLKVLDVKFKAMSIRSEINALPHDLKEAAATAEQLLRSSREQRELEEIAEIAATLG